MANQDEMGTPLEEPEVEEVERKTPNEAGFSVNMFLNHDVMGRIQFTFRGAVSNEWEIVLDDVDRFAHYMRDKGWKFDGEAKIPTQPVQPAPTVSIVPVAAPGSNEPVYVPVDTAVNVQPQIRVATAGRLSVEMKDGKYFYKVADAVFAPGERGTKYGISVYPEVLVAAQLNIAPGQPVPNISGWRVDYLLNEKGYPWKVVRLLPAK